MSGAAVTPLRIAVIGSGAFGRNHLRVYSALACAGAPIELVAVVDPSASAREEAFKLHGVRPFSSVEELLAADLHLDAASICTPTIFHADAAITLLQAGIDVLIEKPIAPSLDDADRILAAAEANGRIVQVGHLERFNPAVTAALPLLKRPMFFESHRLSVFTPRSLDVDVVLDLMIHDLDVVLALANSPVREVRAVGLPVLSNEVDIANVRVEFDSGAVANFTASRVSTERVRKLRFFQPHQYLSLDFARQDLLMIDVTAAASLTPQQLEVLFSADAAAQANMAQAADMRGGDVTPQGEAKSSPATGSDKADQPQQATNEEGANSARERKSEAVPNSTQAQSHPSAGLSLRKVPTEPGEPLKLEIQDFLRSVRTRETPRVPGEAARRALALALQIQDTIRDHRKRSGL